MSDTDPELYEMAVRGREYRKEDTIEMFGTEVSVVLRPLEDREFLPKTAALRAHLDVEDQDEVPDAARDKIEDEKDPETGEIDVSKLDEDFVGILQDSAAMGIVGGDEDGDMDQEMIDEMVYGMVGGYSVELGSRVLELAGSVRDVEEFPGARGGQ